jgi:outer membrane protein TolC
MMRKLIGPCLLVWMCLSLFVAAEGQAGNSSRNGLAASEKADLGSNTDAYAYKNIPSTSSKRSSAKTSVRLSLMEAVHLSLDGNQDIQVVSYTPQQSREDLTNAESVFDTSVFVDSSYRRDPNLQSSVTDVVTEDTGLIQTGVRQPLKSGGSLSAFLETRYGDLRSAEFERTYRYIFAPTVELRQPLLKNIGAKSEKAAITIARHQANISAEELRQEVMEVATRVSKAYWQLFLYQQLMVIDQENLDMAQEVYRRESVRLKQGISQKLDVERARSNAEARRNTLLRTERRMRIIMDQLKLLINASNLTIDSKTEIIPVEEPQMWPVNVDELEIIENALKNRPEIKKAVQELKIRRVEEDLAAHQKLPDLDVFGRYSLSGYGRQFSDAVDDMSFNDENSWAVGLTFEIPLGNRSAKSLARKRILERKQALAQVEREKNQIKQDVKQVILAILFASGEIDSTRLAMEAAEKVVAGEFARFDIGETTNEELLRSQDLLAATSRNFFRAVIDNNIAIAELARAQGILPEGVVLEDTK